MRKLFYILLSVFCLCLSNSFLCIAEDQAEIHSLENLLKTTEDDTNQVNILSELCSGCKTNDPKYLEYAMRGLVLAKKLDHKRGIANSYKNIGSFYSFNDDFKAAIAYYNSALKIQEELGDKKGMASSYDNIGVFYYYLGDLDSALISLKQYLKLTKEIGYRIGIAMAYNDLGVFYENIEDYDKSLEYHFKALNIEQEIGTKRRVSISYFNLGDVYSKLHNNEQADTYFQKALTIEKEIGYKPQIAFYLLSLGIVNYERGKYKLALEYLNKGLNISVENNLVRLIMDFYREISRTYAKQYKYESAYEYHQLYSQAKDSLFNEDKSKDIGKLEAKHEFETAELERERAEAERAKQEADAMSRRDNLQYSGILIFMVLLFSGIFMLGRFTIPIRLAGGMIFFSFLLLFEFTLVLLDPYIEQFSSGAPAIKLGFNALLAALIFPLHSLFENKLKSRIISRT